jgi:maltose O-acetyltransferase
MTAISEGKSAEQFAHERAIAPPDFERGEDEAVARAKYDAVASAFSAGALKGSVVLRLRRRCRWLAVLLTLRAAKRTGRLHRMMAWYPFALLIGPDGRRRAWQMLGADVAETVWLSPRVWMQVPSRVSVGAGSKLGGRVAIESYGQVTIGRNVLMNEIDLFSTQHDIDDPEMKGDRRTITIGDYVWMPHKIIVLPGVRIGSHAVIGTGSVVAQDVPDYGVAVGNPARVVKERARVKYTYVPAFGSRPAIFE